MAVDSHKSKVALFFGSFNPIHKGHYAILKYLCNCGYFESVRIIVSPQNPLKSPLSTSKEERLKEVSEAIARCGLNVEISDVEFHIRRPLYTIKTLRYLRIHEPENEHILIIGSDNLAILDKWHKWEELINEFEIWVYPRDGFDSQALCDKYNEISSLKKIRLIDSQLCNISSTMIREGEAKGEDMSKLKL